MEWLLQIVLLATQLNAKIVIKGSMLIKTSALPASPTAGCALLLNAVFVMKVTERNYFLLHHLAINRTIFVTNYFYSDVAIVYLVMHEIYNSEATFAEFFFECE